MTKTYLMNNLVEKMQSPDQDHRFMGLTDLMAEIRQDPNNFVGDENTEHKVLSQVLKLVEDKISEVKNQAVKCLGTLIKIVRESQMEFIVVRLIDFSGSKDDELRDIAGLALKTIAAELPQDSKLAPNLCAKLTPKLLKQLQSDSTPPETSIETLSILSILISRFPKYLSNPDLDPQPVAVLLPLLGHARVAVRKRTILTLSQFLPGAQQQVFDDLVKTIIIPGLQANIEERRTTVQLVAAVTRQSPQKIAPILNDLVPGVLNNAAKEDDELREYTLHALEEFVLRCPTEITSFLGQIVQSGTKLIKYDPNYAGDADDEDEEMADAEDEDEDDDLDEYSDDEDTSYKIRRAATKLLAALIETRPELLVSLYKDVSPVLISRFDDREETVRLEVWHTYSILLEQTRLYGGVPQADAAGSPGIGGKRKRDDEGMDVEETPYALLKGQIPSFAKALLGQLKRSRTPPNVLKAGFTLLRSLISVSPGSLTNYAPLIISTSDSVLSQSLSNSSAELFTTCLSFLSLFFSTHPASGYENNLQGFIATLLKVLRERHPRIVAESFRVFSSLLNALNPVTVDVWVSPVYDTSLKCLRSADTDTEVRDRAEECMGDLWVCATDIVRQKGGTEWDAMCKSSGRTEGAVKVVARVAGEVEIGDAWTKSSIEWVLGVIRKSGKVGKADAFACLDVLLRGYKNGVPQDLISPLVEQMKPYISTQNISDLSLAFNILTLLLQLAPDLTFPSVESEYLQDIYVIAHSPLVAGTTLDSLLAFFSALVQADSQIATHVIPNLVIPLQKQKRADASYANVAKCIGQVVRCHPALAAGTIAEFSKSLKKGSKSKDTHVVLSLLVLGEIGRFVDFAPQKELFQAAIDQFSATDEEIRSAAAFAAGNIAIGNLHLFLPVIVKLIQNDKDKRLLALHSLKEIVSNSTPAVLETVTETIWSPLFANSASSEESTRNVAAACLGKLTATNPTRYLPQLQKSIHDSDPAARATVIAAIRYTLADTRNQYDEHTYDELLSSYLSDFLSTLNDEDLNVRRLAISALNSAARNKPQLIREHLSTLLPGLYRESHVKPELIKTVQMGPWTHKVDDGLEARKAAYETMYTLLDTCLAKLDLHEFIGRVIAGLADDADEVKVICHMMLFRLSQVAPTSVALRLDEIAPPLDKTMKGPAVTKDTVKQDLERAAELQRSTLRAVAALYRTTPRGTSTRFDQLTDEIQRNPQWGSEFKELSSS